MVELESCPSCGALPCDWTDNPHTRPPADEALRIAVEALRAARRATLHGAPEPRANVREMVDEALAKIKELVK
jgi:hypothetical protein